MLLILLFILKKVVFMRKILFLIIVIALSSFVSAQMLTQEPDTDANISFLLEKQTQDAETLETKETFELNLSQKNKECQLRFECRPKGDNFYYDCYFDENISDCRCFVGLFSRCNLEASNLSIIARSSMGERLRLAYIKDKLRPIMPFLSPLKGILCNWRTYVLGVLIILILIIIFYAYNRDTPANNMRKARSHHKKAQALYEKGRYEEAGKHYKMAKDYRKKVKEF